MLFIRFDLVRSKERFALVKIRMSQSPDLLNPLPD